MVLLTAWGSIALAVEGMKAGAADFVTKPWTNQQVLQTVRTALGVAEARPRGDEQVPTREDLDARYDFGDLLGSDMRVLRILQLIARIAATDSSVLVTGESGTGAYEKLIRVMAHEVNNSVTASNSLLESSLTYSRELSDASRPDFERALGVVIERTEQLNRFMRSFADVFRLPAPVKKPEAVLEILENNVQLLSAPRDAAAVTWEWSVDDRALTVPLDRGQMEQAFLNMLQNAVDATGGRGTIAVRIESRNGGRPRVSIEDSGPGIAPEAQANLFTPFFSTKPNGQGIGLTLVREILTGHGFDYALERQPGEPTRFTILF